MRTPAKRGGTQKTLDTMPPPDQIRQSAEDIVALAQQLKLKPRTVTVGGPIPAGAYDTRARAVVLALIYDCQTGNATTQALVAALKLDPDQMSDTLTRHEDAWQGVQVANSMAQGSRDAQRLLGGARLMARAVVKAGVATVAATLDAAGQAALNDSFQPPLQLEAAESRDAVAKQQQSRKLTVQVQARLKDVAAQRQLRTVLEGLRQGQSFDIATLEQAAATLDQMLSSGQDPTATATPQVIDPLSLSASSEPGGSTPLLHD